jgi:hypothetical protein
MALISARLVRLLHCDGPLDHVVEFGGTKVQQGQKMPGISHINLPLKSSQ